MKNVNSLVAIVEEVLIAILKDCSQTYPDLDFERDCSRLRALIANRGLGFATLDLPSLDKVLLHGLETGSLHLKGPLTSRVSKRCKVPKFLSGLWLSIFDNNGCLRGDASESAIFFLRQIACFGKKIVQKCSNDVILKSLGDFYETDESLRPIELWWFDWEGRLDYPSSLSFSDDLVGYPSSLSDPDGEQLSSDLQRLERVADLISTTLGYYDPYAFTGAGHKSEWRDERSPVAFKHGPGAVADQSWKHSKYAFKNWPSVLQDYFPFDAFASHCYDVSQMPDSELTISKIIDVPKTADKPRLIASEPNCHQWTQQITRNWLDYRFTNSWVGKFIDLHDQGKSQILVKKSSLDRHLCTVDLSSASDRLSAWVVLRFFRKNKSFLEHIRAHRTNYTMDTHGIRREPYLMNKFATQGTAVTFPIQSLVFLACALAVSFDKKNICVEDIKDLIGQVRTYGDDILLPSRGYERLCNLLEYLELKVNKDKSFHKGFFRESCGMDCYRGYDVTPCKPQLLSPSGPESYRSLVDTVNNLWLKGCWHASSTLERLTLRGIRIPIKSIDSGVFGLSSFLGERVLHLKTRWNPNLHREEYLAHRLESRVKKSQPEDTSPFFQYIVERPSPDTQWASGHVVEKRLKLRLGWEPLGIRL